MITKMNVAAQDFSDIKITSFDNLAAQHGATLAAQQLELEHEAYTMGEARFIKNLERQIEAGDIAGNTATKPLLDTLVPAIATHLEAFLESKGKGRPHVAKQYLSRLSTDSSAFIAVKTVLNILAREDSAPIQRVAVAIAKNIEEEVRYGRIREEEKKHYTNVIKPNLDKRSGHTYKKAFMDAVEKNMLESNSISQHDAWPRDEACHVGVLMIEKIIEASGLLVIERKNAGNPDKDHQALHLADAYVDKITSRAHALAGISPMFQPCIVPPKAWTNVQGGGYYAQGRKPLNLIRVGSRRALDRYKHVDMPSVYKAVNTIQNTAWSVNTNVLAVANAITAWEHCPVSDVPPMNRAEMPTKPDDIDTCPISLKAWKKEAAVVYRGEKARQSRRMALEFTLGQANKFAAFEAIYFPYNLDWRGRVYAVPSFSPQGNDITKGMLQFSKGMELGEQGAYYLAVHGSNCAGVDKVSLDDRVQWVQDNEAMIMACAENPLDSTEWADMDAPFCFLAFCFEWAGYVASGRSTSFVSHLPLAFDGTCSGLQHFSAMLRDEVGGQAVNLTPSDKPQDVYGIVAEKIKLVIAEDMANGTDNAVKLVTDKKTGEIIESLTLGTKALAAQWDNYGVTRSVTKRSVMTLAYGSKQYGFAEQVLTDTINPTLMGNEEYFTQPNQAAQYMAKLIWDSVSTTVVAAVEAMNWLQKAAALISGEVKNKAGDILKPALPITWTTPVGFPVWSEYRVQEQKRINCVLFGEMRITSTINLRDGVKIDARKQASGIAPNFIHSMDASHLMLTVEKGHDVYGIEDFAMIHDSFGCHAGKADNLFKCVRETMVDTYTQHDVIEEFYNEFEGQLHDTQLDKMPTLPAKGTLDLKGINESLYTFS